MYKLKNKKTTRISFSLKDKPIKKDMPISSIDSLQKLLFFTNFVLNLDDTIKVIKFFEKKIPEIVFALVQEKYFSKIDDIYDKLAKIVRFDYYEKDCVIINSKSNKHEEIIVISGEIQLLSLKKKTCKIAKEEFLEYLNNLKLRKEDDLYRRCIRNNPQLNKEEINSGMFVYLYFFRIWK